MRKHPAELSCWLQAVHYERDRGTARVTEPFFTTKAREHGTGLGLAIANEIVKMHRGTLSLRPASPRGTRASVIIPTARVSIDGAA